MTQNDNIRHYIGELEATDDIDVVFKHIYDLMLANGGEGSGLNADMVDGYHASDFAPASIIDEIEQCIHTIALTPGGHQYQGRDVVLDILAHYITYNASNETSWPLNVFLDNLTNDIEGIEGDITDIRSVTDRLEGSGVIEKLVEFITNNMYEINGDYFVDANSVNGISFILVTQNQYDTQYTKEQKEDPHIVFIINDDIENFSDEYAPPNLLRAGMNLRFRVNENSKYVEYSIDHGVTWSDAFPLVSSEENGQEIKGILHPSWFSDVKTYIQDNGSAKPALVNQNNYPFVLSDTDTINALTSLKNNITNLGEKWVSGIKLNNSNTYKLSTQSTSTNAADRTLAQQGILNLNLDTYLNTWVGNNTSTLKTSLNLPTDFSVYEKTENKIREYVTSGTGHKKPTTAGSGSKDKYISEYVYHNDMTTLQTSENQNSANIKTIYDFLSNTISQTYETMNDVTEAGLTSFTNQTIAAAQNTITNKAITYTDATTAIYHCTNSTGSHYVRDELVSFKVFNWGAPGDNILEFRRQGNVCQVKFYARASIFKNDKNGTVSGISDEYYDIPLFAFPKGFTPATSGFFPNPIEQHSTNSKYNLMYYMLRDLNDVEAPNAYKKNGKFLSIRCIYPDKIFFKDTTKTNLQGKILFSFIWTYFTDDDIITNTNGVLGTVGDN